jgi:alpha-tubulin suppressor-like RCC1 family protein
MRKLWLLVVFAACASRVDHIPDGGGGIDGGGSACAPVGVDLQNVVAISAGVDFACAALTDGSVWCWGDDDNGQLGSMMNEPGLHCASNTCVGPITVPGATGAKSVAAGLGGACALSASGAVSCWGDNTNGQLGNNSTTSSTSPVAVSGLTTAMAISAGDQTMCALETGGGVVCWGAGVLGQIGDDSTANALTPTAPTGLGPATAIAGGDGRSCAVTSGSVECWGDNNLGELGNGNSGNNSDMPTMAVGVSGATAVSSFGFTTCALGSSGTVTCWGDDSNGELGTGIVSATPVTMAGSAVSGITTATAIATGQQNFACALLANGTVECWGQNSEGQLGDGTMTDSPLPVPVMGISNATAITAGGDFACALLANTMVECWGRNNDAQLGNGSTVDAPTPTTVMEPDSCSMIVPS